MIRATKQVTSWRMRPVLSAAAAALLLAGCPDARSPIAPEDEEPPTECTANEPNCEVIHAGDAAIPGLIVSESRAIPNAGSATTAAGDSGVAYVSVAPGSLNAARSARLRNLTAGGPATSPIPISDGGFDPVVVAANPGDRLELAAVQFDGSITHVTFVVPVRRPPVVVRTNPPKGRTDVALSIRPTIVFSEPIDPQSLQGAVQLLGGVSPVAGTITVVAGSPFMAEFIPDEPLRPLARYELVVTSALRDLQNEALEQELRVDFTTNSGGWSGLRVANVTTGGAFDVDGYQVRITQSSQPVLTAPLELNTTLNLTGLPDANLTVELTDVAANCAVSGGSSRDITTHPFVAVHAVTFDVACTPPPELATIKLIFSRGDGIASENIFTMTADGRNVQQLTSGLGFDIGPIVSPDGSRIAISRSNDGIGFWGSFHVYLLDATGGNARQLTQPPSALNYAQDWSPDGRQLALNSGFGAITLINADGSGRRLLVNNLNFPNSSFAGVYNPAWSPDGSTIVFSRYTGPSGETTCDDPTRAYEIWAIDTDGRNLRRLRRLTGCFGPGPLSWSPDGTTITYHDAAAGQAPALWSMDADGGNPVQVLPPNQFGAPYGRWSPDRTHILLTRSTEVGSDIYLLRVADSTLFRVTADGMSGGADFLR
jgi:Tol biopolymer transport system component